MPELPEVETVRRGLEPALTGARLERVEARRPDLRFALPDGFVQRLTGATVTALRRRAKYLLLDLDRGDTLVSHLGMTGRFEITGGEAIAPLRPGDFVQAVPADPKHAHIVFDTDAVRRITYFDPRRFGYMDLIATAALDAHPWFAALGPEPLGEAFDAAHLGRALAGRRQSVKTLLLDQRTVAGLGNIYVCEALWRAKISPTTAGGDLKPARLKRLVADIRTVLVEAIEAGGSTLRDYAAADGALGYFQHSFAVYGREGEACASARCGGVIQRATQSGRSTFYCDACQT